MNNRMLAKLSTELRKFLEDADASKLTAARWLEISEEKGEYLSLYIRSPWRLDAKNINNYENTIRTFDLASIEIDPKSRGKGFLSEIMATIYQEVIAQNCKLQGSNQYKAIFVECIQEERLFEYFKNNYAGIRFGFNSLYLYL